MNNPGVYPLYVAAVDAAKPLTLVEATQNLDGMSAVSLEASFAYGSGSGTVTAIVVTSFDGGTTWRQIARFDFANAARVAIANIQAMSAKAIANYADLGSEGVNDGLLGDRLAVKIASTGT